MWQLMGFFHPECFLPFVCDISTTKIRWSNKKSLLLFSLHAYTFIYTPKVSGIRGPNFNKDQFLLPLSTRNLIWHLLEVVWLNLDSGGFKVVTSYVFRRSETPKALVVTRWKQGLWWRHFIVRFKEELHQSAESQTVCCRPPALGWLWFVPSLGERRQSVHHLWHHPVYGWESIRFLSHCKPKINIYSISAREASASLMHAYPFSVCCAAPEVLSGGPYNHAADWWSLGILLFSLVTGKVRSFC